MRLETAPTVLGTAKLTLMGKNLTHPTQLKIWHKHQTEKGYEMASFDAASKKQVETNPQDFVDLCFRIRSNKYHCVGGCYPRATYR